MHQNSYGVALLILVCLKFYILIQYLKSLPHQKRKLRAWNKKKFSTTFCNPGHAIFDHIILGALLFSGNADQKWCYLEPVSNFKQHNYEISSEF